MSIKINDLVFRYSNNILFNKLNYSVQSGQISLIQGPSGCGKSTLLKLIAGLITAESGEIFILDSLQKKKIGYLHQDLHLIEHWSIKENLDLVNSDFNIQNKWLKTFDLTMHSSTLVGTLSGGEKQRVGLIRIILSNADTVLLDEPTAHLDDIHTEVALNSLKTAFKNKTVLIVSHDQRVQKYSVIIVNWQKEIIHVV